MLLVPDYVPLDLFFIECCLLPGRLHRTRMALSKLRTALKNRIHATLAKYGITTAEHSDIFVGAGKVWLETALSRLPPETGRCVVQELEALDSLQGQIARLEQRIRDRIALTPSVQLLKTLPGIGDILAIVIEREIGSIDRFDTSGRLTSYAGVVPTVHASGGKTRFGHMCKSSNQYLKWAFIEAANVVVRHRHHPAWKTKYVCQVYDQVCQRKGHAVAVGAVARHLAEAAFWILKRQQPYRPPAMRRTSPKQVQGRTQLVPSEVRELTLETRVDCLAPAELAHAAQTANLSCGLGRIDVSGKARFEPGTGEPTGWRPLTAAPSKMLGWIAPSDGIESTGLGGPSEGAQGPAGL